MRGHIRQRGDGWELRVYVGRDHVTGRERYMTRTVRTGKREAQRLLNQMVVDAERGAVARTTATVGDLLGAWFELAQENFSPKTVRETKGFIDRTLKPGIGHVSLSKLGSSDLDRFYSRLRVDSGYGRGLAPATIRRVHGILRRALQQGVRWGWLGVNVAASASPPRIPPSSIHPPSTDQLVRVLRSAQSDYPELAVYILLSASTGARRSEVLALRWSACDLLNRTVIFERGLVMGPHGIVEKDTKTHAARRVSLDRQVVDTLICHRTLMDERAAACGVAINQDAYVFSSAADCSTPWFPDSISRAFRRQCARAGVDGVRLHDLRHYVATSLLSAGVDVRTVAGRLGHRNTATTLNVYAHFLEANDRSAADTLAGLLAAAGR